jgi:hypothetical protein
MFTTRYVDLSSNDTQLKKLLKEDPDPRRAYEFLHNAYGDVAGEHIILNHLIGIASQLGITYSAQDLKGLVKD